MLGKLRYRPLGKQPRTWALTTLDCFDERIDPFFDAAARPYDFIVVRRKDYLNWRYCDVRAGNFTVRAAQENGRILGYTVLKREANRGYIVDLLALPGRLDVIRSLVEDALRTFKQADVAAVSCWMVARHPYSDLLRSYGFIDARRDVGFSYRPRRMGPGELEFLRDKGAKVHMTHGDSDVV